MAPIQLAYVVSFTSQDDRFPASNLLLSNVTNKTRWQCDGDNRPTKLEVEFHLAEPARINYIDIGNYGSASAQILVGRSTWPRNREFVSLLPTVSFMTMAESKTMSNKTAVRMFTKDDLQEENRLHEWDRIRVICHQPHRRDVPFGISFVNFRSADSDKQKTTDSKKTSCDVESSVDSPKLNSAIDDMSNQDDRNPPAPLWESLKGLKSPPLNGRKSSLSPATSRGAQMLLAATATAPMTQNRSTDVEVIPDGPLNSSLGFDVEGRRRVKMTARRGRMITPRRSEGSMAVRSRGDGRARKRNFHETTVLEEENEGDVTMMASVESSLMVMDLDCPQPSTSWASSPGGNPRRNNPTKVVDLTMDEKSMENEGGAVGGSDNAFVSSDELFVECPVCSGLFTKNEIEVHTNLCLDDMCAARPVSPELPSFVSLNPVSNSNGEDNTGAENVTLGSEMETELSRISMVKCPICYKQCEGWFINSHVNICADHRERQQNLFSI